MCSLRSVPPRSEARSHGEWRSLTSIDQEGGHHGRRTRRPNAHDRRRPTGAEAGEDRTHGVPAVRLDADTAVHARRARGARKHEVPELRAPVQGPDAETVTVAVTTISRTPPSPGRGACGSRSP